MREATTTKPVRVVLSENLHDKVKELAGEIGMSKSAYIAFVLGQWVNQQEKMNDAIYKSGLFESVIQGAVDMVKENTINERKVKEVKGKRSPNG